MEKTFRLIMISAMYENGGNTTHRLLDGHKELFVYPFESQLGTKYVQDYLSSLFPLKYRWPVFSFFSSAEEIYELIIDEECKVRSKTPSVSKFKDIEFDLKDNDRKQIFVKLLEKKKLKQSSIIEAYFKSTLMAWKNYKGSKDKMGYVGYSPICIVDGDKIINDFKERASLIHVVRNPFSAYADTKKRAVPLSLPHYLIGWIICQYNALLFQKLYPENVFIIRYEDIIIDAETILNRVLEKIGFESSTSLKFPSWNNEKLSKVSPWGTIVIPTEEVNIGTALELSKKEIADIYARAEQYVSLFNYDRIHKIIR